MILRDFEGTHVRLTSERLNHVLEHPEMAGMNSAIAETLVDPVAVVESLSDPQTRLYYRYYFGTAVGDKYLCVVVKMSPGDAFLVTAYLTDRIKRGKEVWPRRG